MTIVIFTMEEAAAKLRVSRRALHEIVKTHPYYFRNGRRKLFTEADLASIVEALRPPQPSPLSLRTASKFHRPLPAGSMWKEAQRQVKALRQGTE